MAVQIGSGGSEIFLQVPAAGNENYTITFWANLPSLSPSDPPIPVFELRDTYDNSLTIYKDGAGVWVQHPQADPDPLIESPPGETWVFMALTVTNSLTNATLRWALPCEEFSDERTAESIGEVGLWPQFDSGMLGMNFFGSRFNDAQFALVRQWTTELTTGELLDEKLSSTAVFTDFLWASNPMSDNSDVSDESGNDHQVTLYLLDTVDGPTLCASDFNRLTWTVPTIGAFPLAEYVLERSETNISEGYEPLVTIAADEPREYEDADIEDGVTYWYRIRARDTAGNFGPYSNIERVDVPGDVG